MKQLFRGRLSRGKKTSSAGKRENVVPIKEAVTTNQNPHAAVGAVSLGLVPESPVLIHIQIKDFKAFAWLHAKFCSNVTLTQPGKRTVLVRDGFPLMRRSQQTNSSRRSGQAQPVRNDHLALVCFMLSSAFLATSLPCVFPPRLLFESALIPHFLSSGFSLCRSASLVYLYHVS